MDVTSMKNQVRSDLWHSIWGSFTDDFLGYMVGVFPKLHVTASILHRACYGEERWSIKKC